MPREIISAKTGTVTIGGSPLQDIVNITIEKVSEEKTYATSSTNGRRYEIGGHESVSGSFEVLGGSNAVQGSIVSLVITNAGPANFNGYAHIRSNNVTSNVDSGDLIGNVINWGEAENPA